MAGCDPGSLTVTAIEVRWVTKNIDLVIDRLAVADVLTSLLQRFSLSAGVFYAGSLCGVHRFERDTRHGHVHLIRRGPARVLDARGDVTLIEEPTLVFMPCPDAHQLVADERQGADVVCANVLFGVGGANPITDSLPALVAIPLASLPGADAMMSLLDQEAFGAQAGRQAALDRLCEVLMIRLLRHCLEQGLTRSGTLAGLADPRLCKALTALHDQPERPWSLNDLARAADMSRARFAAHFKVTTGQTPADYLAGWRMGVAQDLLRRGRPLKHVALDVGYGSVGAFARVFLRKVGCRPTAWLQALNTPAVHS